MLDAIDGRTKWRRRRHLLPILAVACLGLVVAVATWLVASTWEARLAKANFGNLAGDYATVLQSGLDQYLSRMTVMRAFYDSSVEVDQSEFDVFTGRILKGTPMMARLSWSPRVTGPERTAFEAKAHEMGLAGYEIRDWAADGNFPVASARLDYFPTLFTTTTTARSPDALGVDLISEPARRKAVELARDEDRLATAPSVKLSQLGGGDWRGFFVAVPVYRQGLPHATVEQRRRNVLGVLAGTFDTAAVMGSILETSKLPGGVDVYVYSAGAGPDALPEFVRASPETTDPLVPQAWSVIAASPHLSRQLQAGDARWNLVLTPAAGRGSGLYRAWIVLGFIVLVFGAVLAYMWASARYALQLETANSKILDLAETDLLTNLPNRRAFLKRLTRSFLASRRRGAPGFAVLYLDIDDFKDVNDTLGHPMGDALLKAIVERLRKSVGRDDIVARFGGDEFAILHAGAADAAAVGELATRIAGSMAMPFDIGGHQIRITSSIGISLYSPEVAAPETMMVQADLALYRGKDDGRNCFRFYSRILDQQVHERVTVTEEMRNALEEEGELELYYQPQVELESGRITGFEALLRWNHPKRGLLSPGYFVPIAERTGTVHLLGRFALEAACRQVRLWRDQGLDPRVVAVNVSGMQLKGGAELVRDVERALLRYGIAPGDLELELTETVLMEATQRHSEALRHLRQLGLKIAIDDFGTGYSSLKYLTIYPINRLKVAQELVFGVNVDYRNAAVVRAAIGLAQELGIDVIAEGVETAAQAEFLVAAGCAEGQGYYFSRPVNAAAATELLRAGLIAPQKAGTPSRRTAA
jgi:diguanylate cyclase (GGDEF)-like protein